MYQQKQSTIKEIKTGRAEKRVIPLNNESRLSYLLTSRRAANKYIKGFRNTQTKLLDEFVSNPQHNKKSISVFKDSLMTLDEFVNDNKDSGRRVSHQHPRSNYNTLTYNNPETSTINRKKFISKHLKTQTMDNDDFKSPPLEAMLTKKYNKSKPINTFRAKIHRLNTSVYKNSFKDDSPYKTSTLSPDYSKRMKSEPAVKHTSVLSKKGNLDLQGYQYIKDLGTGGYARVVLAKKLDQSKTGYFAVKIYDKQKTKQKSKVTNIPREIRIMGEINHPNICRIEEQHESRSTHFIVMEYCGYQSLFRRIGDSELGFFSEQETKKYFMDILQAFIYLHRKRIAHRDVKAENILIHKGQIKLIDFGFSVVPNSANLVDSYCGTPAYMAPQIFNRTPYNPFQAEVWSLGVLLYLMLQGMYPFVTSDEDELIQKIQRGNYKFIRPVSDEAKNLIRWMLNVNPSERISLSRIEEHSWLQDDLD